MTQSIRRLELAVQERRTRILQLEGVPAGPTIVLVHGLGLSADVWRPHMAPLADWASLVVAPDLPGFGDSDGPIAGFDVDDNAAWLLELQRALGLPPALWVGHSVAAQPVARLAATAPAAAEAIVLASPTGDTGALRWLRQLGGLARTAFREPPWLVRRILRSYLTTLPTRSVTTWLRARRHDPLEDAPSIHCPALVVLGDRDPVVPHRFAAELARTLPRGRLRTIPGGAHGAALSHVHSFLDHVRAFATASLEPEVPDGREHRSSR